MRITLVDQLQAGRCDGGEFIRCTSGRMGSNRSVRLEAHHTINSNQVVVIARGSPSIDVRIGNELTLPEGTILKFEDGLFNVFDDLHIEGTATNPVVLTSIHDDQFGGDTEKNGSATTPAPGDWHGLGMQTADSDETRIRHVVVRYAGNRRAGAAVAFRGSGAHMRDTHVQFSATDGLFFRSPRTDAYPVLTDIAIEDSAGVPARDIPLGVIARGTRITASRNAAGNHFVCNPERIDRVTTTGTEDFPSDALWVQQSIFLSGGGELEVLAGTILKFATGGFNVSLGGALRMFGTADAPIVATSILDDSIGGDTNGDGSATTPTPGLWSGVFAGDSRVTSPTLLEHVVLRYTGRSNSAGLRLSNPLATVRSLRIDHPGATGMEILQAAAPVRNAVTWNGSTDGIALFRGNVDLLHATVAGCTGVGIREGDTAYTGRIVSCNSWGNGGGNFGGTLTGSQVFTSNGGFAGINGNIDADPQFLAAASGDLRLSPLSPCIDRGDLVTGVLTVVDHDERPRIADHDLDGADGPDIGAYESTIYSLLTAGNATPGSTLAYALDGPAGFGLVVLGLLNGSGYLPGLGVLSVGGNIFTISPGVLPTGAIATLTIPNDPNLVGARFGLQGLALPLINPAVGNFTNRARFTVR